MKCIQQNILHFLPYSSFGMLAKKIPKWFSSFNYYVPNLKHASERAGAYRSQYCSVTRTLVHKGISAQGQGLSSH